MIVNQTLITIIYGTRNTTIEFDKATPPDTLYKAGIMTEFHG